MRATVICLILAGSVASAQAAALQVYAFSQGGESTCGASGPTEHMANDYLDGPSGKLYQFTPAPGCSVQQDNHYTSTVLGPLTAASTMNVAGFPGGGTFIGSSDAHAAYGQLGVDAFGNYGGLVDPSTKIGSESFATFADSFTLAGPNGQGGVLVLSFTVGGSFETSGGAGAEFEMDYRIGVGPALMLYRVQAIDSPPTLYYQGFVSSLPGLTVGPNSVTGATVVSLDVPFTYNLPSAFEIALFAGETPSSNHGLGGGSDAKVDFDHTATLTGILALQDDQPVAFTIQSGSGTVYTADGVQQLAPEPASIWFLCAGLAMLAAIRRNRVTW
jgi:hypothetical protein